MYSPTLKIGSFIAVYGCRPGAGASTCASMLAALLAAGKEKTLLITTDADIPFDAVSALSNDIEDNHLDELAMMESSSGIEAVKLDKYVTQLTENLGYLRASAKLSHLTKDAAKTVNNIVELACREYRYVILDIGYAHTPYAERVLEKADFVLHVLTQDPKCAAKAAADYESGRFGADRFIVPIVMDYFDDLPNNAKSMEKKLDVTEVFFVDHDDDVYKAVATRDVAGYIAKATARRGVFGKKKDSVDRVPVAELQYVVSLIKNALEAEAKAEAGKG